MENQEWLAAGDSAQPPPPEAPEPEPMEFSDSFNLSRGLSSGWSGVRKAWFALWLGGAILSITDGTCGNQTGNSRSSSDRQDHVRLAPPIASDPLSAAWQQPGPGFPDSPFPGGLGSMEFVAAVIGVMLCFGTIKFLLFLASSWITTGWFRLHHHILQTGEQAFQPLFSGGDRFFDMVLHRLLCGLAMLVAATPLIVGVAAMYASAFAFGAFGSAGSDAASIGTVAAMVVSGVLMVIGLITLLYVYLGTWLGPHALVLENLKPVDALKRSWQLTAGNRWWILWWSFVVTLCTVGATILGLFMLCVGVLVTVPLMHAIAEFGKTESFLLLTRGRTISHHWRLWELRASGAA